LESHAEKPGRSRGAGAARRGAHDCRTAPGRDDSNALMSWAGLEAVWPVLPVIFMPPAGPAPYTDLSAGDIMIPERGDRLPMCVFCESPIKATRRAMITVLVDRNQIQRFSHLGCLRTYERRREWVILSVLEYSVDPPHVALYHDREAPEWPAR
jgi:hypothetical protein